MIETNTEIDIPCCIPDGVIVINADVEFFTR